MSDSQSKRIERDLAERRQFIRGAMEMNPVPGEENEFERLLRGCDRVFNLRRLAQEAEREAYQRERVFGRMVEQKKMTAELAEKRINKQVTIAALLHEAADRITPARQDPAKQSQSDLFGEGA